jgi:hypothetical protein
MGMTGTMAVYVLYINTIYYVCMCMNVYMYVCLGSSETEKRVAILMNV